MLFTVIAWLAQLALDAEIQYVVGYYRVAGQAETGGEMRLHVACGDRVMSL